MVMARLPAILLLVAVAASIAGCPIRPVEPGVGDARAATSPSPPAAPDPEEIAARLGERSTVALTSLRVTARATVDDQIAGERHAFRASLIARPPDALRFRASREPVGEVFSLLQLGELTTIHLPHDRLTFTGPRATMTERAGLLRQLQPQAMVRGLIADAWLARQAPHLSWRTLDAGTIEATGPSGFADLPTARWIVATPSLELLRVFLYDASDTAPPSPPSEARLVLSVVFDGWDDVAGVQLPRRMIVALPRERVRIELDRPDYLVNPPLPDAAFVLTPPAGTPVHPLASLVFESAANAAGAAD